jgi:DNA-binding IclR family transcriptional regulator
MSRTVAEPEDASHDRGGVQSVEVGMRVLGALADAGGEQTLTRIAEMAGMPPAKAHRYLASLLRAGFVERAGSGNRYALGPQALRVGLVALGRIDVIEAAAAELRALRDKVAGSLLLAVWGTNGPTIVRWLESTRPVMVNVRIGSNMPIVRSATGQVFGAFLPERIVTPLIERELTDMQRAGGKPPSRAAVQHRLAAVRANGLGHTAGEMLPGVLALAAPVFNHEGELAAVIAALGPVGFFDDALDGDIAHELRQAAAGLSQRLGGQVTLHSTP